MSDIVAPIVDASVAAPVESAPSVEPKAPVKELSQFEKEWEAEKAADKAAKEAREPKKSKDPIEADKGPKADNDKSKDTKEVVKEAKPEAKIEDSKTFKLKVNGREIEVSESEMVKRAQKADAAEERFAQASKIQKQAEQLVEMLKTNPGAILSKIGTSKEALEEFYYKTYVAPDLMTPEQKQLATSDAEKADLKARLEKFEENERFAKEQAQTAKDEADKEQHRANYSKQFEEALETGGIPKSGWSVRQMAYYMKQALAQGYAHITPKDVLPLVKEDFIKAQREMVAGMTPKQLQEYIGEETVAKLRAHSIEQAKSPKFQNSLDQAASEGRQEPKKEEKKRYSSVYDMLKNL